MYDYLVTPPEAYDQNRNIELILEPKVCVYIYVEYKLINPSIVYLLLLSVH